MNRARLLLTVGAASLVGAAWAGPYDGAVGTAGCQAIEGNDARFVEWATGAALQRGPMQIDKPELGLASFGSAESTLGRAWEGGTMGVASLGDGGSATLTFDRPIANGEGYDFAVFENSFSDTFLELAFVEVSSDGSSFFRFPSISLTDTARQVGGFGDLDPTNLHNLAGKYRGGWGTPFDLSDLVGASPLLDVNAVRYVRLVDVVGSVDPRYGSVDSLGNLVNDPWATPFASSGFDLDAVGVLNVSAVPEPASVLVLSGALGALLARRRWRRR